MALLTATEFAKLCIIPRTSLPSYETRDKVIPTGSGKSKMFDTENPTNALFIQMQKAKQTSEEEEAEIINRIKKYPAATEKVEAAPDTTHTDAFNKILAEVDEAEKAVGKSRNGNIPKYEDSVQLLKYLDTLKREREIALLTIKEQTQKGEVIPTALIQPVLFQHNHYILTEFKHTIEEILREFAKMKSLDPEEHANLKGIMTNRVNAAMEKGTQNTISTVESIVKDFTLQRAVGERS